MIGPFTTLSITREVARIIEVQNLKLDGFQLRENLHQSVSVKLCWWETKQVCILMSNVNLEGWNFGSFFLRTEVPGIDWGSLNAVDGRNPVQKWPLPFEIIWNHVNCLAERFFSESRIGNWPHLLLLVSLFCGLALGSQSCATKNVEPIHWNLELTEPHLSQCIFWKDSKFLVL